MKKIIATVLAMVMALALCTTAFAANAKYDTIYNNKGDKELTNDAAVYEITTDAGVKYDKDKGTGAIKYLMIKDNTTSASTTGYFAKKYVESTKADYDVKLTASGRAPLYLSELENGNDYVCKAVAFTAIGEKCGQYDGDANAKYYTNSGNYLSKDTVYLFKATDTGSGNILVDGKLVRVDVIDKLDDAVNPHDWKAASYDKDNKVATYKCAECGTVATVYKTEDAAWAAGVNTVEVLKNGDIIGFNYTAGKTPAASGSKPSPKTFDAGIALYAAMALTSVAGSAVVIGKKKEF